MKPNETFCAIVFKDTKKMVTMEEIQKHWPGYGHNDLYGWHPPKRVYNKVSHAKTGFSNIPDKLKPYVEIAELIVGDTIIDGAVLMQDQHSRKVGVDNPSYR
jgi:hypothetical protein